VFSTSLNVCMWLVKNSASSIAPNTAAWTHATISSHRANVANVTPGNVSIKPLSLAPSAISCFSSLPLYLRREITRALGNVSRWWRKCATTRFRVVTLHRSRLGARFIPCETSHLSWGKGSFYRWKQRTCHYTACFGIVCLAEIDKHVRPAD